MFGQAEGTCEGLFWDTPIGHSDVRKTDGWQMRGMIRRSYARCVRTGGIPKQSKGGRRQKQDQNVADIIRSTYEA